MCKLPKEGAMQGTFTMSEKEVYTLKILEKIIDKRLSLTQGAKHLNLSPRHLRRLKKAYLAGGAAALISKKRGKTNRRHSTKLKDLVLSLLSEHYADYGPTLAAEKLAEHHQILVSKETIRQWMHEANIRQIHEAKELTLHQPRHRRSTIGELVQMDGSIHDWFEGRGPKCTLLVLIDDATSCFLQLRFVKAETTFDYFDTVKSYLLEHGKPSAFYVDKHNVFKVNHAEAKSGDGFTQFGRALESLDITIINANSPQAKGRVERANRTLQDRLIKELRYYNISTMEEANEFLQTYMVAHNKRFGKVPKLTGNAHVPLTEKETQSLDRTFTIQSIRTISKQLTISFKKSLYLIKNQRHPRRMVGKQVRVSESSNGEIKLYFGDTVLEYDMIKNYDFQEKVMGVRQMHEFLNQRCTNQAITRNNRPHKKVNVNINSGHF
jgi:IS30 family transposase